MISLLLHSHTCNPDLASIFRLEEYLDCGFTGKFFSCAFDISLNEMFQFTLNVCSTGAICSNQPLWTTVERLHTTVAGMFAANSMTKFQTVDKEFVVSLAVAISVSMAAQCGGSGLIAWRRISIPIVASDKLVSRFRKFFWVAVESGRLYSFSFLLSVCILMLPPTQSYGVSLYLYALIGQIAVSNGP